MLELEKNLIDDLILLSLREDLEPHGDLSSLLTIDCAQQADAEIVAKEDGIMSCGFLVAEILNQGQEYLINNFIKMRTVENAEIGVPLHALEVYFKDGEKFCKGDCLMKIQGSAMLLLAMERTILNFLQRLAGIATLTREITSLLENTSTKLLDTRKTNPGMRVLEKMAFKHGLATNHRLNLSDMIMLKENHINLSRFKNIKEALLHTREQVEKSNLKNLSGETLKIEIEINQENLYLLEGIIQEGLADVVMLDNFSVDELSQVMANIRAWQAENAEIGVFIEISGGINPENILSYLKLKPDFISTSYVSKNAHSIDLSMLITKN
ncbi:MAG: carboxylating nicotinate-nucleotide diphosphorylase [Cyanobacteria bacterium REEB446]|nr:carboxylating nicotinate-nucleotide diphosphorylase [Cyanobacteria bacterium REEB446]